MTSSLDLWGLVPYFALAWIASCLIHLAEFAYAEIKGRLAAEYFERFPKDRSRLGHRLDEQIPLPRGKATKKYRIVR